MLSAAVGAGVAACAGFVTAVRGKHGTGKPPCGIWELQLLRTRLKEGGDAGTESSRALAQCKVQQQAVVHLAGWQCWVIQHSLQQVS